MALPARGTVKFGFDAFERIAIVPVALPDAVGLNETLNFVLCPAASVKGRLRPFMLNPAPVNGACVTVILDSPLFVRVTI